MLTLENGDPLLSIWFGNFYRPAFDDKQYTDDTMRKLSKMHFNCVMLDSKAWEDFSVRYAGGEASQYISAQEYMMESAAQNGLSHLFLALYLNGDNLYPNIRFSPPVYGESVQNADGTDGKWYRYWSPKAQDSMVEHVRGLQRLYCKNQAVIVENQEKKIPICSMWDPIVAPSFDASGRARYLTWLQQEYKEIAALNRAYGSSFSAFDTLQKEDYWFACKYGDGALYTPQERDDGAPAFVVWCDNMKWRRYELRAYFASMQQRFAQFDPPLYLSPNLAQWSYFLTVDGAKLSGVGMADLWDTAVRGIDMYELACYVDNCHWYTVPVTCAGDANAYVVSCQHSMMRCANQGRDFLGGIFWGRFLYNDVYKQLTPGEIVGSIVASGAKGMAAYGVNGLDDGGMLDCMDDSFLQALEMANAWAKQVIPQLGGRQPSRVALLFPNAMAAFEPLAVPGAEVHRMDLLGWYTLCCDLGYAPDVIDLAMVAHGALEHYKVLVIPVNTCYAAEPNSAAEQALAAWVRAGGILLHGPDDVLVSRACGIFSHPHPADAMVYQGDVLLSGNRFCAYEGEEILAHYRSTKAGCIVRAGTVYSFGFLYGASYVQKSAPHVPQECKNNALYPVSQLRRHIVEGILERIPGITPRAVQHQKGLETATFFGGSVIVNHTPHPVVLHNLAETLYFQYPMDAVTLLPHSAVFVKDQ